MVSNDNDRLRREPSLSHPLSPLDNKVGSSQEEVTQTSNPMTSGGKEYTIPPKLTNATLSTDTVADKNISKDSPIVTAHEKIATKHTFKFKIPDFLIRLKQKIQLAWIRVRGRDKDTSGLASARVRAKTHVRTKTVSDQAPIKDPSKHALWAAQKTVPIKFDSTLKADSKDKESSSTENEWTALQTKMQKDPNFKMEQVHHFPFVKDAVRDDSYVFGDKVIQTNRGEKKDLSYDNIAKNYDEIKEFLEKIDNETQVDDPNDKSKRLGENTELHTGISAAKELKKLLDKDRADTLLKNLSPDEETEHTHGNHGHKRLFSISTDEQLKSAENDEDKKAELAKKTAKLNELYYAFKIAQAKYQKIKELDKHLVDIIKQEQPEFSDKQCALLRYQIQDQMFQRIMALDVEYYGSVIKDNFERGFMPEPLSNEILNREIGLQNHLIDKLSEQASELQNEISDLAREISTLNKEVSSSKPVKSTKIKAKEELKKQKVAKLLEVNKRILAAENEIRNINENGKAWLENYDSGRHKITHDKENGKLIIERSYVIKLTNQAKLADPMNNPDAKDGYDIKQVRIEIDLHKIKPEQMLLTPDVVKCEMRYHGVVDSIDKLQDMSGRFSPDRFNSQNKGSTSL